jgi:hypothetical protein
MKKIFIFMLIALIVRCGSLKTKRNISFTGSLYICTSYIGGTIGKPSITFATDSTFIFNERSLYEGKGKWKISPNGKYILLAGSIFFKFPGEDVFIESLNTTLKTGYKLTWVDSLNKKFKIKNEETLIDNDYGYVYIKQK